MDREKLISALAGTWPVRMAKQGLAAMKLPGDVYQGNVSMWGDDGRTNPEVIDKSADLGGLVMGGSYAAAPAIKDGVGMGIKAYHGSPHDFDKFDLSKIGTGEGAQAYGHGLYFAEKEGTAKAYRDALSGKPVTIADFDSPNYRQSLREAIANNAAQLSGKNLEEATKILEKDIAQYPAGSYARQDYEGALQLLHDNPAKFNGRMYEVNINADPKQFLDWDKPLSGQADVVKSAAEKFAGPRMDELFDFQKKFGVKDRHDTLMGEDFYRGIASKIDDLRPELKGKYGDEALFAKGTELARRELIEAGIPGIKYLDQGSRGAGQGSSNYVVFDDKLIDIMRKYGLAGLMGPPIFAAATSEPKS